MNKRVTVIDDTLRRNVTYVITPAMRLDYLRTRGRMLPLDLRVLPLTDNKGRQVQDVVRVERVFEGRVLELAVRRARRWIRSRRHPREGAPHHIAMAMAAFHKADLQKFMSEMRDAAA